MTSKKKHLLVLTSIYTTTLVLGVGLFALVHFDYVQNQRALLDYHRAESTHKFHDVSAKVEDVFQLTYQCLRTIARLPGVRELDPDAKSGPQFHGGDGLESNTLLSIQEIYNNLGSNVAVSELYIVPANMDPDAPESDSQAVRGPLTTFDHLIVGKQGGADADEDRDPIELEEIEIYEYRLMKKQLAWMKERYPHEANFNALNYPMIGGPQVVTCDNSRYDPSAPNDKDRSGLVLSMPYYGPDGELRGCVSAVILTSALQTLLPNGNYTVSNAEYDYCVTPYHDGQWLGSHGYACEARKDPDLLVSLSSRLETQDMGGAWSLWMGLPDSDFWESPNVRAAAKSRNLAYGYVSAIILITMLGAWLVLRGRSAIIRINRELEQSVRDQTAELMSALSELKYQKLAQDEHAIVSITDVSGKITYANSRFCNISGYTSEELIGQNHRIVSSGEHSREYYRDLWDTISRGKIWRGEFKNRAKDGSHYWVDATIVPFKDEHGKTTQYVAVRTNITAMKESELRYKLAVNGSRDGLWDWDLLTDRVYYAPQWKRMLGLGPEDEVNDSPDQWISRIDERDVGTFMIEFDEHLRGEDQVFEVELRMKHRAGHTVWMLCRGAVVRDDQGKAIRVAGSLADIDEIKRAQADLRVLAELDQLTRLPNRECFNQRLEETISQAESDPKLNFAVLFFDFDRFKLINDSMGHSTGDALLINIADRFRTELREGDVISRFGGDEFVLLLNGLRNPDDEHAIANRLVEVFAKPHEIDGNDIYSTASVGLVTNRQGRRTAEEIIRDADAAMYQAKAAGRSRVVEFDQEMHREAIERVHLEADLRFVLSRNELRLVYQPIINLESGGLTGFEALLRWHHPLRGVVPSLDFIPIAEDNGLIVPIGEWVLQEACQQLARWDQATGQTQHLSINVNLSLRQLCHPNITDRVANTLRRTGIAPQRLNLEITESTMVDERYDMIPRLEEIRSQGVKLAMDDFGTGHSSLGSLHQLPIDQLKVDRSFVKSISNNHNLAAVMQAIISVADNLGMSIVAEGIETAEQLVTLQALGCQYAQGYYFKPPLSPEQAFEYIMGSGEAASA